jgi:predicted transcriptional regulator
MPDNQSSNIVDLATNLTVAWLTNPNVRANTEDATTFLQNIHSTLANLSDNSGNDASNASNGGETAAAVYEPAVSVRKSLGSREHIISLIDGKPYSTLKRHLTKNGLTPEQYRERFGLKADYPMVAPAYAEKRRDLAKKIGLGRKPREQAKTKAPTRRRGRPPKAAAKS